MLSIYLHSNFYGGLRKTFLFPQVGRFSRSRLSKVTDIGANRTWVCNFLLVLNSNIWSYLAPFRSYGTFYVLLTPPVFNPNFGGVLVAPDRPCWGQRAHGP